MTLGKKNQLLWLLISGVVVMRGTYCIMHDLLISIFCVLLTNKTANKFAVVDRENEIAKLKCKNKIQEMFEDCFSIIQPFYYRVMISL